MRLSIRGKLLGSACIILIAMAIVGWRGIVGMSDINKELNEIKTNQFEPTRTIANANIGLIAWNRATLNHVLAENIQKMDEFEGIMFEQKTAMLERLQTLSQMERLSKRGKELVRELLDYFSRAEPIRDRVVALSRAGKQEEGRHLVRTELRPIIDQVDIAMTEFLRLQERQLDETLKATDERYVLGLTRISWIIGIATVVSILTSFFLSTALVKNTGELVRGAKLAAKGDLTQARVAIRSKDEFSYLGAVFNDMLDSLEENLTERERTAQEMEKYAKQLEETVAELRDTQEQLVRKEKLAVLGQLASGISHELRNPLGVIGNSVYYLNMKVKDADEKVEKHLGILHNEVQRANEIITNLLDFARTMPPSLVTANVTDIVEDALAGIEIPEDIAVETDLDVELPPIRMDSGEIRGVFLNLLANAVGAMPEEGRLEIKTGVQDDFVEIMFRDTGEGIAKENLQKIFEPLFTTKAKGIGLGLAIVKGIVDGHKGGIEVGSEIGMGTTFTVELPL